jgi:hypothetical protein
MYGYRAALMPYTRVYLPRQLATLFQNIHQAEEALRDILARRQNGEDVPVRVAARSRPTRPGAVETNALRVYRGDSGQVAPRYPLDDPEVASEVRDALLAHNVPLDEPDRTMRAVKVPLAVARDLVQVLEPRPDDPGRWSVDAISGLIDQYEDQYAGEVTVYVRRFEERPDEDRIRARLSGPEIQIIRDSAGNVPALALLYWETPENPELWYPTVVFPRGMPTYVFCPA